MSSSRPVFILVPSFDPTGPVKGAFALANALAPSFSVRLVAIKNYGGDILPALDARVELLSLASRKSVLSRLKAYRQMLKKANDLSGHRPTSISICFSADVVNAACTGCARIISSVRSNLLKDYRLGYGVLGLPLAWFHYRLLNRFDHVVAMTHSMAVEIGRFVSRKAIVIGNFVDEKSLEKYRTSGRGGPYRFVFLGSLTERKQPLMVLRALSELVEQGVDATLDVVGGGPLHAVMASEITRKNLDERVRLHGHLNDPYPRLAASDVMVLPSLSEGLARASLESLYLGLPCVLRDVDGNGELITDGSNGAVFGVDAELAQHMLLAAKLSRNNSDKRSLLPKVFRQAYAEKCFVDLIGYEQTGLAMPDCSH